MFYTSRDWCTERSSGRSATRTPRRELLVAIGVGITQHTFEASHRPYVSVSLEERDDEGANTVSFDIVIGNRGSVAPGEITNWDAVTTLQNLEGREDLIEQVNEHRTREMLVGACVFPREKLSIASGVDLRHPSIADTPLGLRVRVALKYRGVLDTIYDTRVELLRTAVDIRTHTRAS